MGKIGDISHHQPTKLINWSVFAKQFDLLFIRVQYGSTGPDDEYANHTENAVKYGVPFYSYAFPHFISVDDARVEARDAAKRQHANSLGMVIDIESEYDANRNPVGITKLPQSVRLEGIKAFVAELRAQGVKRVGAYIAHNVYDAWGIATIVGIFDFVWIPRYGANDGAQHTKPDYACDLWQYTSVGRLPGYNGNLDLSVLIGDKSLEWFTGNELAQPIPAQPQAVVGRVRIMATDLRIRTGPGTSYLIVGEAITGKEYDVFDYKNDWYRIGDNQWIFGNGETYVYLTWRCDGRPLQPDPQVPKPLPIYYVIRSGDTLGKISTKYGTSIAQLQSWNGIRNADKIYAGQKIRVK